MIFVIYTCISDSTTRPLTIVASPGTKQTEEYFDVDFRWTLSAPFDTEYPSANIEIYKGDTSGYVIVRYVAGPPGTPGHGCNTYGDSSLSCITEGTRVGFSISDIRTSDASRYIIRVDPGTGTYVEDSDTVLYIYRKCPYHVIIHLYILYRAFASIYADLIAPGANVICHFTLSILNKSHLIVSYIIRSCV